MEMVKLPSPSQKAPSPKEAVLHAGGCAARSSLGASQEDGVRKQHYLQEELYRGLNTCESYSDIVRLPSACKEPS